LPEEETRPLPPTSAWRTIRTSPTFLAGHVVDRALSFSTWSAGWPDWANFRPLCDFYTLDIFAAHFLGHFYMVKYALILPKNGSGNIWGSFFTSSSGHPDNQPQKAVALFLFRHLKCACFKIWFVQLSKVSWRDLLAWEKRFCNWTHFPVLNPHWNQFSVAIIKYAKQDYLSLHSSNVSIFYWARNIARLNEKVKN
jgi:hypothetical protein